MRANAVFVSKPQFPFGTFRAVDFDTSSTLGVCLLSAKSSRSPMTDSDPKGVKTLCENRTTGFHVDSGKIRQVAAELNARKACL